MTQRTRRVVVPGGVAAPWWRVVVLGLLSVLVGVVVAWGLVSGRSSSPAAVTRSAGGVHGGLSSLPAAARGPVSAALGSADSRYRVSAFRGGFAAVNPGQRLRVHFGRSGVRISSGAMGLALSVEGVSYGGSLRSPGVVLSRAGGNRVVYAGGGLSEWYANGPLGLEQGFTVSRAPAGRPSGPLTLSLALSGDVHAALAAGGGSVVLSRGGSSLRYGDLVATDARGRTLPSRLVLQSGRILLRVDTRGARYPLRIDPLIRQATLEGGEEETGQGRFGASVALSADGDTALVGAPNDDDGAGAAWVFTRASSISGAWTRGAKLTGDAGAAEPCEEEEEEEPGECGFGSSVALSANGETALVGGPNTNGDVGAAWVFTRGKEGGWTRQQTLEGGAEEATRFGRSVALSGDGDTALVGAPGAKAGRGAVWVFARSSATAKWMPQGPRLTGGGGGVPHFGRSVALSGDGETALIGSPGTEDNAGAAWVFTRSESANWSEQKKLTVEGSDASQFGFSVALSAGGTTALVGEKGNADAAWVFTRSGANWSEPETLTASSGGDSETKFGYSVALSESGDTALIGSPHCSSDGNCDAWVFTRSGSTSTFNNPPETLTAERGAGRFGAGVALSASGETALLGAPVSAKKMGVALSFGQPGPRPEVTGVRPSEGTTEGGTTVTISGSNFTEATAVDFGSVSAEKFEVNSEGTSITAESPKEKAGTVDVTVSDVEGMSSTSPSDQFTFVAPVKKGKETGGKEPETKEPGTGGTGNNGGGTSSGTSGGTATGNGAVLAFGPTTGGGAACGVALLGKSITVQQHARASLTAPLKLVWSGKRSAAVCRGTLTLQVKVKSKVKAKGGKKKQRFTTKTIGSAGFAIAPGKTELVTIKLNPAGRALLAAGHGHLSASLVILRVSPGPAHAQSASVRLALQKKKRHRS